MGLAKVYNDNRYPYKENFKGEIIEIPPKGFIEMDYEDAIQFKCAFPNIITPDFDGAGNQKESSYKMIRVEGTPTLAPEAFVCQECGDELANQDALDKHIDRNHLDQLMDPKVADERRKTTRRN